jgi:CheY-like chemotaxis protein
VTKVLYVEDNDDNVYMLKMRLELLDGFEVVTAEDGAKGCAMALSERPDIILMDLEMPGVDGWEATRRLKADPQTRDIPIVALSAHALAGSREKALAAGCDEFDTKPIEFDRLVGTLRRLIASDVIGGRQVSRAWPNAVNPQPRRGLGGVRHAARRTRAVRMAKRKILTFSHAS